MTTYEKLNTEEGNCSLPTQDILNHHENCITQLIAMNITKTRFKHVLGD